MTHIGIEFGSNEIRAVRLSRDHSHVEAFIDRPLNAPPSGFAFSETLRSALGDLGLTPGDPIAIAVAIGRSGSGISSDSGISDFLEELGNRLGEPLIQVADRLGRVAYAPAPSLALVQSAFADTGFAVESIELPPVAAARLVPDGSPGVLRLHSGVDWAARIVGGQLVEALAAPIRDSTEGVLWHPSAGHSQLITDFPIGCDLPGRDRPLAGVAIGAAIGLSRSTRPLQLNREPLGVEDAALAMAARSERVAFADPDPVVPTDVIGQPSASVTAGAVSAPAARDDQLDAEIFDTPAPKSRTRTGRRAAKKAAADLPPSRVDNVDELALDTATAIEASAAPPLVEDTAAAEQMIARARSRAKDDEATSGADSEVPLTSEKPAKPQKSKANSKKPKETDKSDTGNSADQPTSFTNEPDAPAGEDDATDVDVDAASKPAVESATTDSATTDRADASPAVDASPAADAEEPAAKNTPASEAEPPRRDESPTPSKSRAPLGAAPIGRIGQRSPTRPLFDLAPSTDGTSPPAPLPAAEPLSPAPSARSADDPSTNASSPTTKSTATDGSSAETKSSTPSTERSTDGETATALTDDDRPTPASSSLTQRLRDDKVQQTEPDGPTTQPDRSIAPVRARRSNADAKSDRATTTPVDDRMPGSKRPADRSHLSVARADDRPTNKSDRSAADSDALDVDSLDGDRFRDDSFDHKSIDRDVAELAGFGAALADDDYYDDDFATSEFDSGDLSIDEILAEGRRREASYATSPQPLRSSSKVNEEERQTQVALEAERRRELAAAASVAERQRVPATANAFTTEATAPPTKTRLVEPESDPDDRVPGGVSTGQITSSPTRLRALPQPRQDDRVRPPEAERATPPQTRRRGLPLPLMALFALLSVTALVLIAIGFDDPPERTTTTGAEPTAAAVAGTAEAEAAPTEAAGESDADADETEAAATDEVLPADDVDEEPTPAETQRPAISLTDLGPHNVTMADGVITLEGPLPNQEILDLFAERAANAVGDANVVNNMVVHPDAPPPANGNVRVESAVVFTTGGTEIPTQYAATINQTVALMELYPNVTLIIEGHSDADGTPEQNVRFSENRANAIVAWLAASGVSPDRMSIIGYGDARPVASNETDEGKAANRRVDLEYVDLLAG